MKKETEIAVSVVMPVYNGEIFLKQTIGSLLNQSFSNFEIICVDDGSTDQSLALLKTFSEQDNRVKVFTKENGGTAAKAIIYGLNFATGNYFMYSSQDDLFSNDLLEKNYAAAIKFQADAVVPDMIFYNDSKAEEKGIIGINGDRSQTLKGRDAFVLSIDWVIHGFVFWKMELVRKVGFYDYGINSDEFTTRMLYFNSNKVVFTDAKFYYCQNNPNAITKKWNINLLESFDTCHRLEDFLERQNFAKDAFARLYRTALAELLRIQRIFLSNKKSINKEASEYTETELRKFYHSYANKIASIEFKSLTEKIKTKFIMQSYIMLKLYCKVALVYNALKSTQK